LLAAWSFAAIGGCASSGSAVSDRLDPMTGATITAADAPLVFYQDSSSRAAYARDFVSVGPVRVNHMGQYRYFLWMGIWSTMQDRSLSDEIDGFETVTLFADGEPLVLSLAGLTPNAIGASESVYLQPAPSAADAWYEVTIDQLRFIAQATDLRLLTSGTAPRSYEPWDNQGSGKGNLRAFLDYVSFWETPAP
jgi:hypothetical protein